MTLILNTECGSLLKKVNECDIGALIECSIEKGYHRQRIGGRMLERGSRQQVKNEKVAIYSTFKVSVSRLSSVSITTPQAKIKKWREIKYSTHPGKRHRNQ